MFINELLLTSSLALCHFILLLQGIEANPVADDKYFEWTATVCGLHGTDWEGWK